MIGQNIRSYLINNGITQTFISKRTNISMNILNPSLNGKRHIYAEEYFKICEALNVPLDTFQISDNKI